MRNVNPGAKERPEGRIPSRRKNRGKKREKTREGKPSKKCNRRSQEGTSVRDTGWGGRGVQTPRREKLEKKRWTQKGKNERERRQKDDVLT